MGLPSDALRRTTSRPEQAPAGSYPGRVSRATVAGEPLSVTLPDAADEGTLELAADNWVAKPAGLPAVGDTCLVVLDATGAAWVTAWAGQGE